jgi:hypothetical protein
VSHGEDVRERLSVVEGDRAAEGRYPYDGEWLSKEEIDQRIARRARLSLLRLIQMSVLFVVMTLAGLVLLVLLIGICY